MVLVGNIMYKYVQVENKDEAVFFMFLTKDSH